MSVDRAPNAAETACAGHAAGDVCTRGDATGHCAPGECCVLDYAHRLGDGPPPRACRPCLACQTVDGPLDALVLPSTVSPTNVISPVGPGTDATSVHAKVMPSDITTTGGEASTAVKASASRPHAGHPSRVADFDSGWLLAFVAVVALAIAIVRRSR